MPPFLFSLDIINRLQSSCVIVSFNRDTMLSSDYRGSAMKMSYYIDVDGQRRPFMQEYIPMGLNEESDAYVLPHIYSNL